MESSSRHGQRDTDTDPAADLALLQRAKSVVDLDQVLDFGPWWYAPLLAAMLGGLVLFGRAFDNAWNIVVGVVAVLAGGIVSLHDFRRRAVRSRPSTRNAVFLGVMVVITWLVVGLWGTAISSLGYERFVPGYVVLGWLLTTLLFLGIRMVLLTLRRKQAPL